MEQSEQKELIVLDVETQKTFDEVGGYENRAQLGVSYLGIYSFSQDKFFGFFEKDMPMFEQICMQTNPTIIGFNSLHFDLPVMQPYMEHVQLAEYPHIDLLKDVEAVLGHRVKLDSIAQSTLFAKKSGDGLDAVRWYREGNFESIAKYCDDDVRITRDVYNFGIKHGVVYYNTGGQKTPIKATWAPEGQVTIPMRLAEAFKKHEQLHIVYMDVDENGNMEMMPRKIEIMEMEGQRFKAFCHRANGIKDFHIPNVWDIEETGNTFAHQAALF